MIGAPVTAVRTPPLLESYLRSRGVDAEVCARHIEPADLPDFMHDVALDLAIDGLLVTMPHKQAMVRYVQHIDATVAVGSVNTVKRCADGSLSGAQFDGRGLVNALLLAGVPVASCRVWLKGIGGAGSSIAAALMEHGCAHLLLDDTNGVTPDASLARLIANGTCPTSWATVSDAGTRELLINATPLGMLPDDESAFSQAAVRRSRYVADIVADPPKTCLAHWATESGLTLITGRDMVEGQVQAIGNWLLAEQ